MDEVKHVGGAEVSTLVTKLVTKSSASNTANYSSLLVRLMMAGSGNDGFVSAEVMPPDSSEPNTWILVQRFRSNQDCFEWKNSADHKKLLAELDPKVASDDVQLNQEEREHYGTRGNVTTAIVTHVNPGKESEYRDWEGRIQSTQATFPGYQGSYLQPPTGVSKMWVTLLRFDTPESLEHWFASPERLALVEESTQLVKSLDIQRIENSFPGWVPVDSSGNGPPNWKTFLLVLLGLYPIVTCEIRFLMPNLGFLPHAIANLLGNAISVALTTWLTMPFFIKWFGPWLFPPKNQTEAEKSKWNLILLGCYLLVVAAMWSVV